MDVHLAAFTDALANRTSLAYDRQAVENAYYARHVWTPALPAWMSRLAIAIRRAATTRAPLLRHV